VRIYVGNLPYSMTEEVLRKTFEEFGPVVSADIIADKFTGAPRGFGFVEMESPDHGRMAIQALSGKDFDGRALKVDEAKPRSGPGGGHP